MLASMPMTALKPAAACRERLREATTAAHQRLDGLLEGGLADIDIYGSYVCGMHRFLCDAEFVLDEPPLRSLWLANDLIALGLAPLPPSAGVCRARDGERLGWRYVVAGSSMGARVLMKDARRLGFDADHGARFLSRHAIDGEWPGVLRQLGEVDGGHASQEALVVQGARNAFAAAETCLRRALVLETSS